MQPEKSFAAAAGGGSGGGFCSSVCPIPPRRAAAPRRRPPAISVVLARQPLPPIFMPSLSVSEDEGRESLVQSLRLCSAVQPRTVRSVNILETGPRKKSGRSRRQDHLLVQEGTVRHSHTALLADLPMDVRLEEQQLEGLRVVEPEGVAQDLQL